MENLLGDLRYALRMLSKNRGLATVAVLSLALGIGVNTTIFSFVNALLLRPPAVTAPSQLLEVWNHNPRANSAFEAYEPLTYLDYAYYRDHNRVFSGMLGFDGDPAFLSWNRQGQGEMVFGQFVSGNFFSILDVQAKLGRTFLPEEDQTPGTHPVVVVSDSFWRRQLSASPNVVGTTLVLNGTACNVIGVAPSSFHGMLAGFEPDVWAPIMMFPTLAHDNDRITNRGAHWLLTIGRLNAGVKKEQAQADLSLIAEQIAEAHPNDKNPLQVTAFPATLIPAPFRGYVVAFTSALMVVVGLVLIIACANAASLLLAQATARRREIAIRAALGATRARLMRQTLTESVLLACLGGGGGIVLSLWAAPALLVLTPPGLPVRLDVSADARVLGFTLIVSMLTGIVFGLAPALSISRSDLDLALKDEGYSGGHKRSRLRSVLVVAQVAVCLLLLVGAGLCVRSLLNAGSIDPGFNTKNAVVATVDLGSLGYSEKAGSAFYRDILERLRTEPGIQSVSIADYLPLTTTSSTLSVGIEGQEPQPGEDSPVINAMHVGPGFFRTMETTLLRGHEFTEKEERDGSALIINQAMADRFWNGEDPIGRRVKIGKRTLEVVGVVATGKYRTLSERPQSFMYLPFGFEYQPRATLVARTAGDPSSVLPLLRSEVQALDSNVVLNQLTTLEEYMRLPLFPARATGLLLGAFGVLALSLAITGLYGMITYFVAQRRREIAVRVALGADRKAIVQLVVGKGLRLTIVGVVIGLAGSLAASQLIESLLYGIGSTDLTTYALVTMTLISVSLVACLIPAYRAAKIDPMKALRAD